MVRIAHITLDELGQLIFKDDCNMSKSAEELLMIDFKVFRIVEHKLGVGQSACADSKRHTIRRGEFLEVMAWIMQEQKYAVMILMLTDILAEGSHLL